MDVKVAEVLAGVGKLDEHRIREGLPRERRSGRAEGDGDLEPLGDGEDARNLFLGVDLDNHFGVEAVEGGVRAVGEGAHGVGNLTVRGNEGRDLLLERTVAAIVKPATAALTCRAGSRWGRETATRQARSQHFESKGCIALSMERPVTGTTIWSHLCPSMFS